MLNLKSHLCQQCFREGENNEIYHVNSSKLPFQITSAKEQLHGSGIYLKTEMVINRTKEKFKWKGVGRD